MKNATPSSSKAEFAKRNLRARGRARLQWLPSSPSGPNRRCGYTLPVACKRCVGEARCSCAGRPRSFAGESSLSNLMVEPKQSERIKPPALKKGDTIGIVAPASSFQRHDFDSGCEVLRQIGYKPAYDDSIFDRDLYFAGSVERRARECEEMFVRDEVEV